MSHKADWQAEDVVRAALGAWRAAQTEAQYRDQFTDSLRQLAAHINIRLASAPDEPGLFDSLQDIDHLASQVLNGSLVKRLHNIWSEREQRATLYSQASNVCARTVQAIEQEQEKKQA